MTESDGLKVIGWLSCIPSLGPHLFWPSPNLISFVGMLAATRSRHSLFSGEPQPNTRNEFNWSTTTKHTQLNWHEITTTAHIHNDTKLNWHGNMACSIEGKKREIDMLGFSVLSPFYFTKVEPSLSTFSINSYLFCRHFKINFAAVSILQNEDLSF